MKSPLTSTVGVFQQDWTTCSKHSRPGSGYCEDQGRRMLLLRDWRLWGVRVWRQELDREEMPGWAWIGQATLGHTEWKTRFNCITIGASHNHESTMRLYKTTNTATNTSAWQSSQAEASAYRTKAVAAGAKRADVTTKLIDIPTGKEGLLAWLNENT